jgi:hypothetical protein
MMSNAFFSGCVMLLLRKNAAITGVNTVQGSDLHRAFFKETILFAQWDYGSARLYHALCNDCSF